MYWYEFSGTNEAVAFIPGEVLSTGTNIFGPVSPLSLTFSFLFLCFLFFFSSHLISIESHPDPKSQIIQVSNQDKITKFTSFKITISTHHITSYINLVHVIRFAQQHNKRFTAHRVKIRKNTRTHIEHSCRQGPAGNGHRRAGL